MEVISRTKPARPVKSRRKLMISGLVLATLIASSWVWRNHGAATEAKSKPAEVTTVVTAVVAQSDVPVRLTANGTVSAQQTVVVRPQLSAVIKAVHIKEGQFVQKGETLFSLDARTEDANLSKTEGQLAKSRADLRNAERNLERQRELYRQNFISQAALDVAENQADAMRGQLAVDQATVQANRIARGFSVITAPIAGRTGAISVYQGSLVQPTRCVSEHHADRSDQCQFHFAGARVRASATGARQRRSTCDCASSARGERGENRAAYFCR